MYILAFFEKMFKPNYVLKMITFIAVSLTSSSYILSKHSAHHNYPELSHEEILADFTAEEQEYMHQQALITPRNVPIDAVVLQITTDPINAQDILAQDFYLRTHRPFVRSLHEIQQFKPHKKNRLISCSLFFNQVYRAYFDKNSKNLSSYVAFRNSNLLEIIDERLNHFNFDKFDIPKITELFDNLKLQQHRLGAMIALTIPAKNYLPHIRIALPIYYQIHNFFLTEQEQKAIEKQALFNQDASTPPSDERLEFFKQHLVSDKLGVGDTNFSAEWKALETAQGKLYMGIEFRIPSAYAFSTGIIGGTFENNPLQPTFNFEEFFDNADDNFLERAKSTGIEYLIGAMDRFTRILADHRLGQRHTSLGALLHYEWALNRWCKAHGSGRVHCGIPHHDIRFFSERKNPALFVRDYANANNAESNLLFLTNRMTNMLYPQAFQIRTSPGHTVQISNNIDIAYKKYTFTLGHDAWYHTAEKIAFDHLTEFPLYITQAARPSAWQGKIVGGINGPLQICCHTYHLVCSGEYTYASSGIGKEWGISIALQREF